MGIANNEPDLSVVVASMNGFPYLGRCLTSLRDHCRAAEVIVVDCTGEETRRRVQDEFPSVQVVSFEEPVAVPELRAAGIAAAKGSYVAVIEDPCMITNFWSKRILDSHGDGHSVVGGAIRNGATERLRDWAAFFCEYSEYLEPVPAGPRHSLLGMNVSYDRRALGALEDLLPGGHWEYSLHAHLRSLGFDLYSEPGIVIAYLKKYGFREFLTQCFNYSRSFARMRSPDLGWRRVLYAGGAPLVAPYLYVRIARNVLRRRRYRTKLMLATPLIFIYLAAWAFGEMLGYGLGRSDRADAK